MVDHKGQKVEPTYIVRIAQSQRSECTECNEAAAQKKKHKINKNDEAARCMFYRCIDPPMTAARSTSTWQAVHIIFRQISACFSRGTQIQVSSVVSASLW